MLQGDRDKRANTQEDGTGRDIRVEIQVGGNDVQDDKIRE